MVTGDLRQSGQADEMWALTRTNLSIVTWSSAEADPVVQWGQVMAYLAEIRRVINEHGPSIVSLPRARLHRRRAEKASAHLGVIAHEEGRAVADVRHQAEQSVREALQARGELARFEAVLARPGRSRQT